MTEPPFQAIGSAIGASPGEPLIAVSLGRGMAHEALLYFPIFYPELEEIDGHVLLYSQQFESREELRHLFRAALTELGASPTDQELEDMEKTWNVFEVEEGFVNLPRSNPMDDAAALALANAVRAAWEGRLAVAYPTRQFRVEVLEDDGATPLLVVFWEDRRVPHNQA